jgi:virginiamycin B lyase
MQTKLIMSMTAGLAVMLLQASPDLVKAQGQAALTGKVTSEAEGAMEGVVVSAKKAGSTVMVSVTTNAQGQYSFPDDRLDPGQYAIAIRAVGYDLDSPATTNVVAEKTTTADIKLQKTKRPRTSPASSPTRNG